MSNTLLTFVGVRVELAFVPFNAHYTCLVFLSLSLLFLYVTGKVHGSLARAGKVRGQTPKVMCQQMIMNS